MMSYNTYDHEYVMWQRDFAVVIKVADQLIL